MPRIAPIVFVSSTKADLAEYRQAIQQSLPSLDVLYRGMEFFGSRPERPHDVIIQELIECDLYLGILAHRYGSIEPVSGLSYTQLEYQTAKQERIPTMLFLIDPVQPVQHESVETDADKIRKLAEFKALVSAETVVEKFTTAPDLAAKVGRSLQKWLDGQESQWRPLRYFRLDERENDNIRKLYSSSPPDVMHAITSLHRPDCREAHEHLYGLLYRSGLDSHIRQAVFEKFIFSHDDVRVSQMLMNMIDDLPHLRPEALHAIGERATIPERSMTEAAIERVVGLATDDVPDVRDQVAHALGKIGARYPSHLAQCRECLTALKTDPVEKVRDRATISLRRLPQRGRVAGR